jgi:hypothetical protein
MTQPRLITLLTILLYTFSLVWCGDVECGIDASDASCAAIGCSLLSAHNDFSDQGAHPAAAKQCSCVCHVLVVPAVQVEVPYYPPVVLFFVDSDPSDPKSVSLSVYHPPLAS